MQLSVTNHSFEVLPLEGTFAVAHSLGFRAVDIAGFHARGRCSLEPAEIAADPRKQADAIRPLLERYKLRVTDFFPQFGAAPPLHSLNDPDGAVRERNLELIEGVARFAKLIGSPGMTILPGVDHSSRRDPAELARSKEYLERALEIAASADVELRFEPHMGSIADTPELALELVEAVPGLKVTLDVAHFTLQYIPTERVLSLIPHTGHVHVRQAKPGTLQTAWDEGTIDFLGLARELEKAGYEGAFSVEYVCADWFGVNRNDTLFETTQARDALSPFVPLD
ncbi:MAG: TIM barrel protein [Spirochaetes bacterium]|jgi:sugar phosphate isomerase/epimerase|nr:TIM barrel protein [Spirochaetota bacterium]